MRTNYFPSRQLQAAKNGAGRRNRRSAAAARVAGTNQLGSMGRVWAQSRRSVLAYTLWPASAPPRVRTLSGRAGQAPWAGVAATAPAQCCRDTERHGAGGFWRCAEGGPTQNKNLPAKVSRSRGHLLLPPSWIS